MRQHPLQRFLLAVTAFLIAEAGYAQTSYVSKTGTHTPPYDTWAKAATNLSIFSGSNGVSSGTVLINDGTYVLSSEIIITNPIAVCSVSGWSNTIIQGDGSNRCFSILHPSGTVKGLTIQGGREFGGASLRIGGGVYAEGGYISECYIKENQAQVAGGGVFCVDGTVIERCFIATNNASDGGGIQCSNAYIKSSVIARNIASGTGGGALVWADTSLINCTIAGNSAGSYGGGVALLLENTTIKNTIVYHNSAPEGSNYYNFATGNGYNYSCLSPQFTNGMSNTTFSPLFVDLANGDYRLQSNSPCIDKGANSEVDVGDRTVDGSERIFGGTVDMGAYEFSTNDVVDEAPATIIYISKTGSNIPPYDTWAKAATNLAVLTGSTAVEGVVFLFDSGVYDIESEIVISNDVELCSVNGWSNTVLRMVESNRCMSLLSPSVSIKGFTIRGGRKSGYTEGGGIYSEGAEISDCYFTDNESDWGGAIYARNGTVIENCYFMTNTADFGGGLAITNCTIRNSLISGNSAPPGYGGGGGILVEGDCVIANCTITWNSAGQEGGGMEMLYPNNECRNTIIYFNAAPQGSNYWLVNSQNTFENNCMTPTVSNGVQIITNDPKFINMAGDYRLRASSPCIDAGSNDGVGADERTVDGNARIAGGTVDMGAYEVVIEQGGMTSTGGAVQTTWNVLPDAECQLEYNDDLTSTNWMPLGSVITADQPTIVIQDNDSNYTCRAYRLLWLRE